MTRLDARHVLWFETEAWASRSHIVRAGAGCLSEVDTSTVHPTGLAALQAGLPVAAWRRNVDERRCLLEAQTPKERAAEAVRRLQNTILTEFPESRLVILRHGALPGRFAPPWDAREAVRALLGALRGRLEYRPRGTRTCYAVLTSGAKPLAVAATGASSMLGSCGALRQLVTTLSVAASVPGGSG